jgi:hypothetical protein
VLRSKKVKKLELSATQTLSFDQATNALLIEYRLKNEGEGKRKVAPWQNTRVAPGGLTFFPASSGASAESSLKLQPVDGIVWYQHTPVEMKKSQKAFCNGQEGWLAHVTDGLLFLKLFEDVQEGEQAPGQGEIEIYAHEDGSFVEVEQQGVYAELGPGEISLWPVRWLLRPLPESVKAEVGNAELLAWVRDLAKQAGAGGSDTPIVAEEAQPSPPPQQAQ